MEQLHRWLEAQFAERKTEPNSGLGKAITYLLRHWKALTTFLREAGVPLDNNLCERALKRAVLYRKNALFYRTLHGAEVSDSERQRQRLPSSLLIESSSPWLSCAEAFPIKASDKPGLGLAPLSFPERCLPIQPDRNRRWRGCIEIGRNDCQKFLAIGRRLIAEVSQVIEPCPQN